MKHFTQNIAVKIISFILIIILVFSLFVSVIGIYVMAESNVYFDGGEELIETIYENYTYKHCEKVEEMLYDKFSGYNTSIPYYERVLSPKNTNLRYTAVDDTGVVHGTNMTGNEELVYTRESSVWYFIPNNDEVKVDYKSFRNYSDMLTYVENFENENINVLSTEIDDQENGEFSVKIRYQTGNRKEITISFGILKEPVKKDILSFKLWLAELGIAVKDAVFVYSGIALILCIILFVILMCGMGHKKGVDGIYICKFHKIPFDVYVALNILLVFIAVNIIAEASYSDWGAVISFCVAVPLFTAMILGMFMTFAARVKADGWYKNTLIFFCLKWLYTGLKYSFRGLVFLINKLPMFYKTLLVLIGLTLVELMFLAFGIEDFIILWIFEKIVIIPIIIYFILCMRELQNSARKMAQGDTEHKADTRYMIFDFKEHGEVLNGIGNGLALAVEKNVKSERMKAELITNVSHDIKTPLTSIINYVDLLKREGLNSENAVEYLEVLERQSGRLKRLTEDLVEASKASTGNIAINIEKTDINVLLTQAAGEYEERMADGELSLVLDVSEEELIVEADGRHMWRVFDNLMNNICKYAQPNTRVYISACKENGKTAIVFRNISREPLNIAPEELTERFVRGDKSRNTEGSGLGLSIAKSLTELQGGQFSIQIDGDLFKVTIII